LQVDAYAELPYFMNPLLAACQLVNVSQPGAEPQLTAAQEDMRLFSPALADKDGEQFSQRVVVVVEVVWLKGGVGGVGWGVKDAGRRPQQHNMTCCC
jgi:hypothetical protein